MRNQDTLLDLFENEGDFHQLVADDVSRKAGIPITTTRAKTINYLMSFGGGPRVLQAQLGTSFGVAKEIHEAYRAAYPEIFEKAWEAQQVAEADMQIDMWSGRTRHFVYPGGDAQSIQRSHPGRKLRDCQADYATSPRRWIFNLESGT